MSFPWLRRRRDFREEPSSDDAQANPGPRGQIILNAKQRAKRGLVRSGLLRSATRFLKPGVAILRYHSVQENRDSVANTIGSGITHSRRVFEEQMEILVREFHPVSLPDVVSSLEQGRPLPNRSVLVTFDDGYLDNFEVAFPILSKYGIPAAIYVIVGAMDARQVPWFARLRYAVATTRRSQWTDATNNRIWDLRSPQGRRQTFLMWSKQFARLCGTRQQNALRDIEAALEVERLPFSACPMLCWNQARVLHQAGHTIGSHTATHANSAYLPSSEFETELVRSKQRIEHELGVAAIHFSYPSPILEPHFTRDTIRQSKETGYRSAVTCEFGLVRVGDDPLSMRRVSAPHDCMEFRWVLENSFLGRNL